eukprot:7029121-Pyramimonas_sp.AAC.1
MFVDVGRPWHQGDGTQEGLKNRGSRLIFGQLTIVSRPANLASATRIWAAVDCPRHSQHSREMITYLHQIIEITPHLFENDGWHEVRFHKNVIDPAVGAILHK